MLIKVLIVICFIIAFKVISNFIKWKRCEKLSKMHIAWLADECDSFPQYKGEIKKLLKNANISDSYIPMSQHLGLGQISNGNASVYLNFPSRIIPIASSLSNKFDEAIGTYRNRVFESFNPIYWIETLIFLPKNLLQYIGLDSEKVAFKLCNILLTFIWWILGVLLLFFKPQINDLILSLLG